MITMTKRFYRTSTANQNPGMLRTYNEAVEEAKEFLENNQQFGEVNIVEVIAVARRDVPKPPIVIEKVRR